MRKQTVPPWLISLGFALGYAVSAMMGRLAVLEQGTALGLYWPAAGVGVLWFLVRGRIHPGDLALFIAITYLVNDRTGSTVAMSVVLLLANLTQLLVFLWTLQRLRPQLWGVGGNGRIDSAGALGAFLAAAVAASFVGAGLGSFGLWLVADEFGWLPSLIWVCRNLCGLLAIGCFGYLVAHWLLARPDAEPAPRLRPEMRVEIELLLGATVAAYGTVFALGLPLVFPLLALSVWAGLRLPTILATGHAFVCGVIAVVLTRLDIGAFAVLDELQTALLLQLFVIMAVVTSLALATSRDEQATATAELQRSQRESAAQADLFEAVLESMHDGVLVLDGRDVVFENPGARQQLRGTTTPTGADVVAAPTILPDGAEIDADQQPVARALGGEQVNNLDLRLQAEDGYRIMSVSARPLKGSLGEGADRAVIVFRDVTKERARLADLIAFSSVVAHDLRNPLQVIDGWLEQLETDIGQRADPRAALATVARVQRASARMRDLIQDLLDHALSVERVLDTRPIDLRSVAREARHGREVDLEVATLPDVVADRVLVRQLFDNLVGNAAKYVDAGVRPQVCISGELHENGSGRWVRVRVADNGIGIPADQHQLIFRQFHRAHAADYAGTGLGLSICQRIVERHGGSIRAFANPKHQGSVFEFTLPAH